MYKGVPALALGLLIGGNVLAGDVDEAVIRRKIQSLQQSAGPRDWRKIPWVSSLLEARKISREEQAPVFMFTYDGNIDSGRC